MGERAAKDALFAEFAEVGKALASPKRLELLDLLAQGPRSVEDLATTAELAIGTCSAHLQVLREAGLVSTRREGRRVFYSLGGDDVAALSERLRQVAQRHRPATEPARRAYLGPDDTTTVGTEELLRLVRAGDAVVVDVRPAVEFDAGHLPGARNIPLDELAERIAELPGDREVVAYCRGQYCVFAHDAVRLLTAHGLRARRATDGILEWRAAGVPVEPGAA
ncbi:MAG TPA: metalloregulator ArsR/SmtB family transcription factor [Marmoricola sp.]|nr:metalloregulator ArsR/SmtB family transcription factor [Marmoricola sp.]